MAENADEKKVKKEDNQSLIDRVNKLLKQNEELLAEQVRMKKQLADQQALLNASTPLHHERSSTTNETWPANLKEDSDLLGRTVKTLLSKRIGHLLEVEPITCAINQDVIDWLEAFEDKCNRLLLPDEQKFSIVQDLLKDSAKMWFDTHKAVILDWSTFKEKIIAHFELIMSIDSFTRYKQLYNRRRFMNESAVDYFHEMIKLCHKANSKMDEATQIKHLLEGLSLREKSYIDVRKPETTERFLQILIESDKVILEEIARQSTSNQTDRRNAQGRTRSSTPASQVNNNPDSRGFLDQNYRNTYQDDIHQVPRPTNRSNGSGCWSCGGPDHYRQNCPKNC